MATPPAFAALARSSARTSRLQQTYAAGSRRYARQFTTSPRASFRQSAPTRQNREKFRSKLGSALKNTKVQWYPIPVGLGIGFLGLVQFYKTQAREKERIEREAEEGQPGEPGARPKKRPRIRPDGPWQVRVMSTLPLKALSRLWGKFNEINIPYYLRVPGFKLYSFIFGVNLSEVAEPDLHVYPNLAAFFYRNLKPGVRPLDPNPNALLAPSDGRVLQLGQIEGGDIEQVKGMTYTIDALLGKNTPTPSISSRGSGSSGESTDPKRADKALQSDEEIVRSDEEFARVNGISYSLPSLFSGDKKTQNKSKGIEDQSTDTDKPSAVSEVRADLALGEKPWYDLISSDKRNGLYYVVVYLCPGDYHRFHSPTNWVVERRRHFAGELYSVSPYLQRTLPGLFTLNERVVLLGRWRWGFFSYVPVGATNVGSIKVNFDRELRTNSLTTDTAADRAAEEAAERGEPYSGFAEATYEAASAVLGGHALKRGEEMGGFQLGSTIVLVFEAPLNEIPGSQGGFRWAVEKGQKVKMGQALGYVEE
ncbi:phosphatidylserine decarboxylase-domain-containing protein [Pseudomassariella vexata]|uniref:Phosphatidylserine decarboxylase proenzyme 1, mitochondrial n=1 Tax=Pseudomassariella vexata TaxID=1141098 RepID=A0A1Y2EK08_9PEZI|nr:phosphatidylserine decarboxylase-domain-containing protein [Pseudomassariella vexata]ORY71892.1 phosphatidylserine decarboxylase-domain-containing protein [Pseudomassariella vexata]